EVGEPGVDVGDHTQRLPEGAGAQATGHRHLVTRLDLQAEGVDRAGDTGGVGHHRRGNWRRAGQRRDGALQVEEVGVDDAVHEQPPRQVGAVDAHRATGHVVAVGRGREVDVGVEHPALDAHDPGPVSVGHHQGVDAAHEGRRVLGVADVEHVALVEVRVADG